VFVKHTKILQTNISDRQIEQIDVAIIHSCGFGSQNVQNKDVLPSGNLA
jgi:hypothetical protein